MNPQPLNKMSAEALRDYLNKVTPKDFHSKCSREVAERFNSSHKHQEHIKQLLSQNVLLSSV